MGFRWLTSFVLALASWGAIVTAQLCAGDNVYFDLQSSASSASVRLTGHSLVAIPSSGFNIAILSATDLDNLLTGVHAPTDNNFNTVIDSVDEGDWLLVAVYGDGSNLNADTVTTLTTEYGASANVGTLEVGQGYVLVAQKGAGSPTVEVFANFNSGTGSYDAIATRVCAATLLDCPVSGDGMDEVLMARSGGVLENGYDADIVIGGHYEWANCEEDGLCVLVLKSDLSSRFPNGSYVFADAATFLAFVNEASDSILDSDYVVMAVDTDASAIFGDSDVQTALSRWPAAVSSYVAGTSYLFIGRAQDLGPIAEYRSGENSVISLQCLNAVNGPYNTPATPSPTPAPTNATTPAPTQAPSGNSTDDDQTDDTVVAFVDISINIEFQGQNLTLNITQEFSFQKAVVETVITAVEAILGADLNLNDFQLVNLTFHTVNRRQLRVVSRRLEAVTLGGALRFITSSTIYEEIADALDQLLDADIVDIFNSLVGNSTALDSFKLVQVEAKPAPEDPTNDDPTGGGDDDKNSGGKQKSNDDNTDEATKWASSTTGIVVLVVCGTALVGAIVGGIIYKARGGKASLPPTKQPATDNSATPAAVGPDPAKGDVEQTKSPE